MGSAFESITLNHKNDGNRQLTHSVKNYEHIKMIHHFCAQHKEGT